MLNFNLLSLLLIVLGAAFLGLQTPQIAAVARVYPLVMIALVIACALAIAAQELAGRSATPPLDAKLAKMLFAPMRSRIRVLGFVAVWLAYTGALPHVGFIVATTCAISISLWLLAIRRPLVGVATATAFSLVISILFATTLYIPTPSGPVDQLLTQAIYAIQHRGNSNDH
ncbi:MAG TPA: tripartite tricarboxylate transporter TctB family protein [Burkholderiales bacterium]|nr:tripartite tricarboxylate transporter TctB family protein [Burkholderiales bacterium]